MTSVTARGGFHAVGVPGDGDGARGGGLIDLDPGARLRLQALDGLAAATDDAPNHLLGTVHELLSLSGADTSVPHGSALQQILHESGGDVDATGGTADGDLARHTLREVLVDGDVRAALSLKTLDGLATLTDDASDEARGTVDEVRGGLHGGGRRDDGRGEDVVAVHRRHRSDDGVGHSWRGLVGGRWGHAGERLRRLGRGFGHRGGCRAMRVPGRTSVRSAGGREGWGVESAVAKRIEWLN